MGHFKLLLAALLSVVIILSGCTVEPSVTPAAKAESISWSETSEDLYICVGSTSWGEVTITPSNFEESEIVCVSDDPSVATIQSYERTENGLKYVISAVGTGSTTVYFETLDRSIRSDSITVGVLPLDDDYESPSGSVDILNFGDSIAAGENNNDIGYSHLVATRNGMTLKSYAKSGATVVSNDSDRASCILYQVQDATETDANYVLLEGGYNDCYHQDTIPTGTLTEGYTETLDTTTFCGALENLLKLTTSKYASSKVVYIIAHKAPARDGVWEPYTELIQEACEKWNVDVIDMYHDSDFDCYDDTIRSTYADQYGSHPNEAGYLKYYVPMIEKQLFDDTEE